MMIDDYCGYDIVVRKFQTFLVLKTTRLPPVKLNQLFSRCFSTVEQRGRKEEWRSYSVQAGLLTGEGESESQRKTSVLHAHVVEEVTDTLYDVIKQLQESKYNNV